MIKSKKDLKYYLCTDKVALRIKKTRLPIIRNANDNIWLYQILLRKEEYYANMKKHKLLLYYVKLRRSKLGIKLGYTIPINVFGPGLSIAHPGTIVVNSNCIIGKNCRIQTGVTLGATNGSNDAPKIGDNVFLGDGCKIIGSITIADDVAIGANAVVVKSILEEGTTWGGIPAKKISDKNSHSNLILATSIIDKSQ